MLDAVLYTVADCAAEVWVGVWGFIRYYPSPSVFIRCPSVTGDCRECGRKKRIMHPGLRVLCRLVTGRMGVVTATISGLSVSSDEQREIERRLRSFTARVHDAA
ncbi:MAG: hypothetical protein K0Q64_2011, partial [Nitrobacter vulgaris]|nr:hypothetical protein [Nitrobacter vulgaris]